MQSLLIRYKMLAKRWLWLVILGIVLCGGGTYVISKLTPPVYEASALIVLNLGSSANTPYENINGSLAALPTYSQLLTNSAVLKSVVVAHKGLTLNQLNNMITVKPQANTQIIELDVKNTNPQLAMELANEVSYTFAGYENKQNPAAVQILPAQLPEDPVSPRPLSYAGIGALVGLALALALIVAFEWIDDRLANPEEVQEILGFDTLTIIPQFSRKQGSIDAKKTQALAEGSRVLAASLKATQAFIKPFKVVMVTSALAGEGKSTIAAHLASSLAMTGKNVLLVDTNLRHPVLDQRFQMDNQHGLSNAFLEKGGSIERLDVRITEIPTLRVLTSGVLPSNPPELLQSPPAEQLFDHFKKSSQFDYVILDAPPLLPVADAQILASYAQVTLLVIDASKTPRKVLLRAKQVLNRTRTTVIGVALNKSPWPDYNDIRQYLRGIAPKAKSDVTMPPSPPVDDITIPTTPRMNGNGMAESDSTISIPTTPRMNGNEVADPNSTITIPLRDTKQ